MSKYKDEKELFKTPIVIIREIQKLDHLIEDQELGKETFRRLFEHFQPRKQGTSKVPVIIETSDFLWSRVQQMSESRESFKPYRVQHFNKEEIKDILVFCKDSRIQEQIFTEEEFNKVWEHTGGHQGTLYTLHDSLIAGETLDGIIEAQKRDFFGWLRGVIVDIETDNKDKKIKILNERKDFLLILKQNNYELKSEEPENNSIMLYFLNKNVLFYDGKIVTPQNKPIINAIEDYIHTFVEK